MTCTIITVVYNNAEHIEQSILSVINQTYEDVEYIVIDGGSTDGTLDIIKQYDDQITHWVSEPDQGIYDALNKGIQLASGDYIGICHSGDWLEPSLLEKANQKLQGKDIQILTGKLKYWLEGKSTINTPGALEDLKKYCSIFHTSTFIKKELFDQIGMYPVDYRIAGDYYWFLKAYLSGVQFIYWDEVVNNFKAGGLSDTNLKESYKENYRAQSQLLTSSRDRAMAQWFLRYRMLRLWAKTHLLAWFRF